MFIKVGVYRNVLLKKKKGHIVRALNNVHVEEPVEVQRLYLQICDPVSDQRGERTTDGGLGRGLLEANTGHDNV